MKKTRWIGFTAGRYLLTKRKEKGHVAFIFSIAGISVGVMTLITVLGVMNGFQQGYISNINEIKSYHLRINTGESPLSSDERDAISKIKGVRSITGISETQTIIQTPYADPEGAFVRGIEPAALWTDEELYNHMGQIEGDFNLEKPYSIVMGKALARKLAASLGDKVFLQGLVLDKKGRIIPKVIPYRVTGIFQCGFYEIDRHMVFINLEESYKTLSLSQNIYGVKLENHFHDRRIEKEIENLLANRDKTDIQEKVISWRDYNKSFFGALLAEKIMMMIVVSLVFIVVAVNLFQSLKRSVMERVEEIALIKAIGGSPLQVQSIFILEGVIISLLGGLIGTIGGLAVVLNINSIFKLAEWIGNKVISILEGDGVVSIYSGSSFYLSKVPVDVMPMDVTVIVAVACLSSIIAAFLASFKLSQIKPADVIHYE